MRNNRGMFVFTFRILDAVFPDRYPRARCPTAYMFCSFSCLAFAFLPRISVLACYLMLYSCATYVEFIKSISEQQPECTRRAGCCLSRCLPST